MDAKTVHYACSILCHWFCQATIKFLQSPAVISLRFRLQFSEYAGVANISLNSKKNPVTIQFLVSTDQAKNVFFVLPMQFSVTSTRLLLKMLNIWVTKIKMHSCVDLWLGMLLITKKWLLDFAVTRFMLKLFRTSNTEIIAECQHYFGVS